MAHRILVLYNLPTLDPSDPDAESEREAVDTADEVRAGLIEAGYQVTSLGLSSDPAPLLQVLKQDSPDVVFNLFEGIAQQSHTEAVVAGILEWFRVPYTGCPPTALMLAHDKPRTKLLLAGAGLPTAEFLEVRGQPIPSSSIGWPVIVKPGTEDASVGLDQGSVVQNQRQLEERCRRLLERYGPPVLVERYIAGREINVSVVEDPDLRVLPLSEILFDPAPGHWPIVTYDAKWRPRSREYLGTPPCCPADVEPQLADRIRELALEAYRLLGCRQYARVDFRIDATGQPYILEVNPNPDYHPTAGLTRALIASGCSHREFTLRLVSSLVRGPWSMAMAK
jgi:D-alanine-D-alanine ligase